MMGCKTRTSNSSESAVGRSADEPTASESGVEKVKPAPGTGNVQGKVFYNSKPVENIEVKLCETFSRFVGGCGGAIYSARTDSDGEYVITKVPPKTYQALLAKVFDTESFVFATSGIAGISASKYEIVADQTFFAAPTHLFKGDLKTLNPKAGAKVVAEGLELKWEAYPDASYYEFSLSADNHMVPTPYTNERVEGTSFTVDKTLEKGGYRLKVSAYNGDNRKLSETEEEMRFTVQ